MQSLFEDIIITKLSNYAKSLSKQVYVVGGAVRDLLIKREVVGFKDIDLAGNLTIDEIIEFLTVNKIRYEVKNKKLEVIGFCADTGCTYEYARLREEKYLDKDTHTPSQIMFVDDVVIDAKRRDFTVNSVYYDRHSNLLIDPVGGIADIGSKNIIPVLGEETFKVDPVRIVRFIELVSRFDFIASAEVLGWVKKYANNVSRLSEERLKREVERLTRKDKYQNENFEEYIEKVKLLISELNLQNILIINI